MVFTAGGIYLEKGIYNRKHDRFISNKTPTEKHYYLLGRIFFKYVF